MTDADALREGAVQDQSPVAASGRGHRPSRPR